MTNLSCSSLGLSKANTFKTTFFDASLGRRPSKFWRSIFSVKDVIVKGSRFAPEANRFIWNDNTNAFSVKNAYRLSYNDADMISTNLVSQQSDSSGISSFWY